VLGIFPRFRPSYVQQYNLTVEHEITPWQVLLKAGYVEISISLPWVS
jgi:hypothetical protein